MSKLGNIYVVKAKGFNRYKIGFTTQPRKREKNLQNMSPVKLKWKWSIVGTVKIEKQIHQAFDEYRLWGEWFELPEEQYNQLYEFYLDPPAKEGVNLQEPKDPENKFY